MKSSPSAKSTSAKSTKATKEQARKQLLQSAIETAAHLLFALAALVSIAAVVLICVFLAANGIPALREIGVFKFISGDTWRPANNQFGILPMITASLYVTAGAIIIGVPPGILTAIFLSRFAKARTTKIFLPAIELLAGIPSVVYGFFGLVVVVPAIRAIFPTSRGGFSILAASLILGIMILPTIITVSKAALDAVPDAYYEGSLALGATHERSVFCATTPAAASGIMASVVLGVGRAIGETMAVAMVIGNQSVIPTSIIDGARTMTGNIVLEMGYAADLHRGALIATAVVLFVFILVINISFNLLKMGRKS
jgi:phosphate transport system permease protein